MAGEDEEDERDAAEEAFLAPKGLGNWKAVDCQAKSNKAASDRDNLGMFFFFMTILL